MRYVNDSKATNADAAEKALACYADIYWIAGGQPKEDGIAALGAAFPAHPQGLSDRRSRRRLSPTTLDRPRALTRFPARSTAAVADARQAALADGEQGAVVLLSPACASFDQFKDFEERGERFRALVAKLRREARVNFARTDQTRGGAMVVDGRPLDAAGPGGADRDSARCW